METGDVAQNIHRLGCRWIDCEFRYLHGRMMLTEVCSKTDAEIENLLQPGGVDLSPLSHTEQGTRLRRLKRLFTEGHLFDVKCAPFVMRLTIALSVHS